MSRKKLGAQSEQKAKQHLQKNGYLILKQNHNTPVGEVDIICQDEDEIVFVEVKSRQDSSVWLPEQQVNQHKLHKIKQAGELWLKQQNWEDRPCRIDVITVSYDQDPPIITHFKRVDFV